ncbi:MAG: M3 family oligoendopeptidase [Chloroflexi bacterium]|uniref:M3 family oligoendopeptidase n=1 Tax=Candidatus Flexifilum breve TaxID=3140694 RepID=UPI0031367EEA|nr:M3 family oligoendopeptidase [Chloroflexota bacterium]
MADVVLEQKTGAENVIWDLSIFYQKLDDPAIDRDMERVQGMANDFAAKYRGRVAQLDPEEMVDAMVEMEAIYDVSGRIGSYASLNFSTDTTNPQVGRLLQRVREQGAKLAQTLLFFDLEWKAVDDAVAAQLLAHPTLGKYRHPLEADLRYKPYTLSEIEEQLIVEKDVTGAGAWVRFFTQLTSAMRFDWEGEKVNQSKILDKLHSEDRAVREKAAESVTAGLREKQMELTYIFNTLMLDKANEDQRRGYPTWISARNLSNKAPDAVVEALIQAVTSNYDIVARHYQLKRALLGLDELRDYDRYAPLKIDAPEANYSWEEARQVVHSAYTAFSPRLGEIVNRFFDENWIHAPVLPNKRGGAFAAPTVASAHPFVFVNYLGKDRDIMTLAHELGHGVHMYLSGEAQGQTGLYTPLTTAEMASVFGEMLTFEDLMRRQPDPAVRLKALAHRVEDSFATVFRQVTMNRFEDGMHTARRSEGELPTERINQIWLETQRKMFGDSVTLTDNYGWWWSYIGHFIHTPGYVYAYAFGELLVLALFNVYRKRGADFVPQYLDVLAAGDSDYPDRILAKVGVDLTDPNFWNEGLAFLRGMVEEEERLAREVFPEKF